MNKVALITGVTGQDGAYLARSLLNKGYKVYGGQRRSTAIKHWRLDEMGITKDIEFVELDLLDHANIRRRVEKVQPDYFYNLAAHSFVWLSFDQPELVSLINGVGVLRCLEAIRGVNPECKFYQAGTSEMFGKTKEVPQNENTPFYPRSPYGVAKVFAHNTTVNYRESYGMFAANGILFNHESPFRGEDFVTRKISKGIAIWLKDRTPVVLGNIEAQRDWGHAEDFMEGIQLIMSHEKPDDFVLATGVMHSVKEFAELTLNYLDIKFYWDNNNCYDQATKKLIITTDKIHHRPAEVDRTLGDSTKAKHILHWTFKHTIDTLVKDMVDADLRRYYKQ